MLRPGFGMPHQAKGGWLQVWSTGLEKRPQARRNVWVALCVYPHLRPLGDGSQSFVSVPFEELAGIRPLLRDRRLHWTLVRLSPLEISLLLSLPSSLQPLLLCHCVKFCKIRR